MTESPALQVRVVARYSYEAQSPEDLSFKQGDSILLLTKGNAPSRLFIPDDKINDRVLITINYSISLVNQDWFEGQCNGGTGIFPAAYVDAPVDA